MITYFSDLLLVKRFILLLVMTQMSKCPVLQSCGECRVTPLRPPGPRLRLRPNSGGEQWAGPSQGPGSKQVVTWHSDITSTIRIARAGMWELVIVSQENLLCQRHLICPINTAWHGVSSLIDLINKIWYWRMKVITKIVKLSPAVYKKSSCMQLLVNRS